MGFRSGNQTTAPRDFFTREERKLIREVSREYGSIPSYNNVTSEERKRVKAYPAQPFEKPKEDMSKVDWKRTNGWKIPSPIGASTRDCAPSRSWVDLEDGHLHIPKEEHSKNKGIVIR